MTGGRGYQQRKFRSFRNRNSHLVDMACELGIPDVAEHRADDLSGIIFAHVSGFICGKNGRLGLLYPTLGGFLAIDVRSGVVAANTMPLISTMTT